jgi:Mn2+/Fe2+ NRAMP family transporter
MLRLRERGPGIVIAATGLGAGDLIVAPVAGAKYGIAILWAAALGALLKFTLNEGLARWRLATGATLLEGWVCCATAGSSTLPCWPRWPCSPRCSFRS